MKHLLEQFERRIPESAAGLKDDIRTAFSLVARFKDKAQIIRRDPLLSSTGIRAKIDEAMQSGPAQHMRQLSEKTAKAIEAVKARRGNLTPSKPRDDSTVGELRRAELRTYLRGLSDAERVRLALSGDVDVEEAIVHGAAALSGLQAEIRARVVAAHVERAHGPALAALRAEEDALEVVMHAVATAAGALERESRIEGVAA